MSVEYVKTEEGLPPVAVVEKPRWTPAKIDQRREDLHHQWLSLRLRHRRRPHEPRRQTVPGDFTVHRRRRHTGLRTRAQAQEARHGRTGHLGAFLLRCARARRCPPRRTRPRVHPPHGQPADRAHAHRFGNTGRRQSSTCMDGRIRLHPASVRADDRSSPSTPADTSTS